VRKPLHEPTERLALVSTATAVSYTFRAEHFGWACCTVNESTGELAITSDWGNWAHRWNPRHLGSPSLHAFLGEGSLDYIANKLMPLGDRREFDPHETSKYIRARVLERRRSRMIDEYEARGYWDALGSLADVDSSELYLERLHQASCGDLCDRLDLSEPWEMLQHRESYEYRALMAIVLPPLCAVCATEAPKYARQEAA
jgi:hypothetical protein